MSDFLSAMQDWYKAILLQQHFPAAFSFREKLFSSLARKQHFAERRFLKEKRVQILAVTHALGTVSVFKQIPDPPKSEVEKVVTFVKQAMQMDPELFENESQNELVADAVAFLNKHDVKPRYASDPIIDTLAKKLKDQGHSDTDLNRLSDFAKGVAEDLFNKK